MQGHLTTEIDSNNADEVTWHFVVFTNVTMSISNDVYRELMRYRTVPTLMSAIKERYDVETTMTTAVDVSLLFTTRGHVAQFDQTLDKLEQLYDNLAQHEKAPDAATYVFAINLTTSQQYK